MLQCPSPWIVPEWLVYHLALWQSVLLPPASLDQNLPRSRAFLSTSCWQVEYRCCKTPQKRSPLWRRLGSILYLLLKLLGKRVGIRNSAFGGEWSKNRTFAWWRHLTTTTRMHFTVCRFVSRTSASFQKKNTVACLCVCVCACVCACVRARRANLRSCICEALTLLAIDLQYLTQHFGECHAGACKRTLVVFTSTQVLENNLLSKRLA